MSATGTTTTSSFQSNDPSSFVCQVERARESADTNIVRERVIVVLVVALPLTALHLLLEAMLPADPLVLHRRSTHWMILSAALLVIAVVLARLPSRFVAFAAGVLVAGVLGNLVWAVAHHGEVANPLVVGEIAFNLADVLVLAGLLLVGAATFRLAVRYRELLPQQTVAVRLARTLRARFKG